MIAANDPGIWINGCGGVLAQQKHLSLMLDILYAKTEPNATYIE